MIALIVIGLLLLLLVGGCFAAVALLGRSAENFVDEVGEAIDDFSALDDSSCRFVELDDGSIGAEVTVTNTTDAVSDYNFLIDGPNTDAVEDGNSVLGSYSFDIDRVGIGETTTERTGSLEVGGRTLDQMPPCSLETAFRSESN